MGRRRMSDSSPPPPPLPPPPPVPHPSPPPGRLFRFLPPLLLAVLAAAFASCDLYNPDIGAYIGRGEVTLDQGRIPRPQELLCADAQTPFLTEKWAWAVLLAAVWRRAGAAGLVALRTLLLAGIVAALYRAARPRAGAAPDLATAATLALALVVANERLDLRPELVSFLCLALYLWILEAWRRGGGERWIWVLPALQAAWVNCHAYFVFGLAVVGAYAAGAGVEALWRRWRGRGAPGDGRRVLTLAGVGAACAVACLANPSGLDGALYPVVLARRFQEAEWYRRSLFEFLPPTEHEPFPTWAVAAFQGMAALLVGVTLALPWTWRAGRPSLASAVLAGVVAVGAFQMRRNLALFALVAAPYATCGLSALFDTCSARAGPRLRAAVRAAGLAALAAAVTVPTAGLVTNRFYVAERSPRRFGLGLSARVYPAAAEAFLDREGIAGPALTNFDVGSYLMWRAPLRRRPFMDSLSDFGLGLRFFDLYRDVMNGTKPYREVAERLGMDYAVLRHTADDTHGIVAALARDPAWALVEMDSISVVFLRRAGRWGTAAERLRLDPATCPLPDDGAGESAFDRAQRHFWLGALFGLLGVEGREEAEYRAAIALAPDFPEALANLGEVAARHDAAAEAERLWQAALAAKPDHLAARHNLGMLYLQRRRSAEALAVLERGTALCPAVPLAWDDLGRAYAVLGRYAEAARCFEEALGRAADDAEAHASLYQLYSGPLQDPARAARHRR